MDQTYFEHVRSDIADLLPAKATRIVDVGCGAGSTLAWLRGRYPSAHTIGLEGNAAMASQLSRNADEAHVVDLTGAVPDLGSPDLILFLDVLEHLSDPVSAMKKITSSLAPDGKIIVSLPNIAHYSVSAPLFFGGQFEYEDAGILDRTHLRFFVRKSAVELLLTAGFTVERALYTGLNGRKLKLLDASTLGRQRMRLAKQFVMRGAKAPHPRDLSDQRWGLATP